MKAVSDLFPRLLPYVPGCPDPVAQQALVDAAIEFCEDSMAVRVLLDNFSTIASISTYDLNAPTQQRVSRVLSVKVDGANISPLPQGQVHMDDLPVGVPCRYAVIHEEAAPNIVLFPTPATNQHTVSVYAAVCPTREATTLDESLAQLYLDILVHGALSKLHMMPNQPYTEPALATRARQMFKFMTTKARVDANKGRVVTSARVANRPLA